MIEVLGQFESAPEEWPVVDGVTGDDLATCWLRIEGYIAHRFAPREVTWLVESTGGDWTLPLRPASNVVAKLWTGDGYETVVLATAPGGYRLPAGRLEVTADVGAGPVPSIVTRAVQRLHGYMTEASPVPAGASSYSVGTGQLSERIVMGANAAARALQNSGAADLLRTYRGVRHGPA